MGDHSLESREANFLKRMKEKYGDKYDLSEVLYFGSHTKVKLICNKHGPFMKKPSQLLAKEGNGCRECVKEVIYENNSIGTEAFIKRAAKIHEDKHDYSLVDYKKTNIEVLITCKDHGVFLQRPDKHLRGQGCRRCSKNYKPSTEDYVQSAKNVHKNLYDYSKTVYQNQSTNIEVLCKSCDTVFTHPPRNHLRGAGCPTCHPYKPDVMGLEEFVKRSKDRFGDLYDYSETVYVSSKQSLSLFCNKHHLSFETNPRNHLVWSSGCPCCKRDNAGGINETTLSRNKELASKPYKFYHVNLIHPETGESFSKIGLTCAAKLSERTRGFKPYAVEEVLDVIEGRLDDLFELEQLIIETNIEEGSSYTPEHKFGGWTECFKRRIVQ